MPHIPNFIARKSLKILKKVSKPIHASKSYITSFSKPQQNPKKKSKSLLSLRTSFFINFLWWQHILPKTLNFHFLRLVSEICRNQMYMFSFIFRTKPSKSFHDVNSFKLLNTFFLRFLGLEIDLWFSPHKKRIPHFSEWSKRKGRVVRVFKVSWLIFSEKSAKKQ